MSPADSAYPRDLIGYGETPPHAQWPGDARIAVSIVVNYEEGAEYSILHGDGHSESILSEVAGLSQLPGQREVNIESMYEYGSRAGFWRVMRILQERELPVTIYACGMALERNPAAAEAIARTGWEVCSHGWRWIDYHGMDEALEREHMARNVDSLTRLIGRRPVGWYTGRPSQNTRRLVVEHGGFLYDSDGYADDLPYWETVGGQPHLIVPHQFDNNDSKLVHVNGFSYGGHYEQYLRDNFDMLYAEGAERPKMMTISLHSRIIGRPGRAMALIRALDHIRRHDRVWFTDRQAIARHWAATHPAATYPTGG
ncbi:MAG: allantoinase PuuE [Alphaproteobacteria bacterium]